MATPDTSVLVAIPFGAWLLALGVGAVGTAIAGVVIGTKRLIEARR